VKTGEEQNVSIESTRDAVTQVWAEVLQRDNIGPNQNFFDLGGNSLKALDVISRLQAMLNIELPLIAFFEDPTVAHLTAVAAELRTNGKSSANTTSTPSPTPAFAATEVTVAQVWAEVLQHEQIATTENFFDLGGDSLKALEVISRLQALLNVELPLIAFFEEPTITHLASVAEELRTTRQETDADLPSSALSSDAAKAAPLSFPQLMYWLLQQMDPLGYLYHQTRAVRIRGDFRADILQRALDEICRRHEVLRARIEPREDEPVQVIDPEGRIELQVEDLRAVAANAREDAALAAALRALRLPFDLSTDLPWRTLLLQLGDDDHILVIVMHHVVADGHTGSIFFDELSEIYGALLAGKSAALPDLAFQYPQYAEGQREQMRGPRLDREIEYWRSQLEGAPASLILPTDEPRPAKPGYTGERYGVIIAPATLLRLKSLSQTSGSTLFTVMMGALRILLYRWTSQSDIVIGTVTSNRTRAGSDRVIGCFLNFLPLRNSVSGDEPAVELLRREKQIVMDGFAHQDCPFLKIATSSGSSRITEESPLYNVALLLQNFPETKFTGDSFTGEFVELNAEKALLDLRFVAVERAGELQLDCEFRSELFNRASVQHLLEGFVGVLETLADDPSRRISDFALPQQIIQHAEAARKREVKQTIAITSTFTAEPVEAPLAFWMKELGIQSAVSFAPYNQVFQQLLDPSSLVRRNPEGINIVLLRLSDWQRFEENVSAVEAKEKIEHNVRELVETLQATASSLSAPMLVCLCPPEQKLQADSGWSEFFGRMEQTLASELDAIGGVHVITSSQIAAFYPVENYEDQYADKLGHIPYTPAFFVALGSMLARRIFSLRSAPRKVIVLDCDNTLWKGVCGEEGPTGVSVDAPQRALQELMLKQIEAGMLICLCSKNAEEDVQAVFSQNSGMVLRNRDIAARRVNWNSKSQNLRELAAELQLGLDSFVFLDDNPIECAEVETQCPEVLTLLLPQNGEEIPGFLRNVWAFDHWKITEEDARRTEMYRENAEREQVRKLATTLDDFLAGLELKLDIHPMQDSDLSRVAQLTERTNQFNFTTIRRNESEVRQFLEGGGECLVAYLSDRFGDYGLVGVILYSLDDSALAIDTLLLSCRALGRKVEHHMLSQLGDIARERNLDRVLAKFIASKKNQPALDFLNSVGEQFRQGADGHLAYDFPAGYAAEVYMQKLSAPPAEEPGTPKLSHTASSNSQIAGQNRLLGRIATLLGEVNNISRAMDRARVSRHELHGVFVAPRTATEEIVAGAWAQLLKLDRVGIHDNFFALGGQSLLATQVVARVRQILGVEVPLRAMFEAPTVAEFAQRIEAALNSGIDVPGAIPRVLERDHLPLSFAQQRLWFLDQLDRGNPLYNLAQMMRLRGKLNVSALQSAVNKMVARHEALRTSFVLHNNEPVQAIARQLELSVALVDLSSLPPEQRDAEIERRAREEAQQPFDLGAGPVMRAQILKIHPEDHVLLLTMHHSVSDRWSLGLAAEELAEHYRGIVENRAAQLPELAIQYADFAVWQRQALQGDLLNEQLQYWKKKLAGAPGVLELPADHARPAQMSMRGAWQTHVVPKELVEKLNALSQEQGVTLFMTLLAAFQTLMARYSGQNDIVVGSPIAGRSFTELEPLIGFFVNTLALRGDLSDDPSFRELLARTKETCLQAYAYQDIPFEKLVEELQPERSLSHNPIFQVLFAHQNAPMQTLQLPGVALERTAVHPGTSILDMSWFAMDVPEGMLIRVEYSTDLFRADTIARSLEHFSTLLQSIAENPGQAVSQLALLGETEKHKLLVDFNANEADFPVGLCMHNLFEQSAARSPDAIAVVCGNERTSYRELNQRANQIAHRLINLGAGPDVLIGVFLERNSDLLPAILGVLKSGSAYVPLDPSYPRERLAAILEDAKAPLVLTQQSLLSQLAGSVPDCICLDADWHNIGKETSENPGIAVKPENLGYVLFTSGSTGRPKGVALEHRSAVTFVHWAQTVFTPSELAGVLLSTSVCFDLSIFEIFVPLSVGGKVIVIQNALDLPNAKAREEVTLINTVPSAIAELVRMKAVPESVKTINLAGEALPDSLVNEIYSATSVEKVFNLYGPTEDTTYSTYTLTHPNQHVTIGKPLPNTQAYILDARRNLQPISIPGELHLAGEGLARGYYGRPEMTAERFLANPFNTKPGARMYRTGDLCRWLSDGTIQYLGRLDHQVKLRGFRIELGEIESVLAKHSGVRQSLVIAREDEPGLKRLVAYIVLSTTEGANEGAFRAHLKQSLPEFMIPSAFVTLDAFPLSPNGKIDRKALPKPEYSGEAEKYVAPRNPAEEQVAAIWAKVLRLQRVGIHDDFFGLGGHSLLATQVVSRVRQSFGVELPLRALFEAPTVVQLAKRVEDLRSSGQADIPPIQPVPRNGNLPLSFAQQRLWFLNELEPDNPLYNVPIAVGMSGNLNMNALERSLSEIVRRHEILRTSFRTENNQPNQVIAPYTELQIELTDLTEIPESEQRAAVQRMAIEGAKAIFNLRTGPLFRASVLRLNLTEHVLLLNMHHIISDGWSLWQLVRELGVLYGAFAEGKPSPLPDLPIQYSDYGVWQRQWMRDDLLEQHLAYWTKQLEGAPGVLELPADRIRPAVQTYRGTTEKVILPLELLTRLREISAAGGSTMFMTLLAAYKTLLFRYTRQEDIVVGTPIANRTRSEIEELIGFFVNTLVMRTSLSGSPTFRELLQRVRDVALGAYAHQSLPFEKLVEVLQPERDLTRTPVFQIWFALQNAPRLQFNLPGLDLRLLDVHNGTSKFDLGLFIVEKPDGLHCMVEYSTDLFDRSTIVRFIEHFRMLLEGIAADPDQPVAEIPILPPKEQEQVLVGWNRATLEPGKIASLHQFFEEQVRKTPDAPALVSGTSRLSYRELNERANRIANRLIKLGTGPEILVGVFVERTSHLLPAILGVLKSGSAYVPLDPMYPRERLSAILQDAKAPIVLTHKSLSAGLEGTTARVICVDSADEHLANESQENPEINVSLDNLAYVLFTSGSTGRPKGVALEHRSAVTFVQWAQTVFSREELAAVLLSTSVCFDLSVFEMFVPLSVGGKIVLVQNALYLPSAEARNEVTLINTVPSAMAELVRMQAVPASVKTVNLAGEALPETLVNDIYSSTSVKKVYNLYGPTEDTTYSTYTLTHPGQRVTIGRPLPNSQAYVLDPEGNPQAIGVPGELFLAGAGLARGYFGRPDLTRERFVRNPFGPADSRMYRTGDLCRWLPDGELEYLGRLDHQVKLRGFRIELGEIESVLDSHQSVRKSVVMAREDQPGQKQLVAYVVPKSELRPGKKVEAGDSLTAERLAQWAVTFDEAYRQGGTGEDATFNIAGWNSSYTGKPIPPEEMRVWVETTVERILSLRPRRVWEIGCGTGLLLFRIAPKTDFFHGSDVSQAAMDFLQQQIHRPELHLPSVTLACKAAHEFDGVNEKFDTIVVNSVIQYFPNLDYLMNVISGVLDAVRNGGSIFIGDVRSFPLLETFHTSIQLHQATGSLSCAELQERIRKNVAREGELLVDPEFFTSLRTKLPRISHVEIHLKRGRAHNELTRFRYDVVLHVDNTAAQELDCSWLDWSRQSLSAESLRETLRSTQPEVLGITGVPNARISRDVAALAALKNGPTPNTVAELQEFLDREQRASLEPEDLWSIADEFGYYAEIRPSALPTDGTSDVLFRRKDGKGVVRFPSETHAARPPEAYATNPLRSRLLRDLVPELRRWLDDKLPEYMVPPHFMLLDSLPLSPNGKVDRKALPPPEQAGSEDRGTYVAPRTPGEEILAAIWADVLRLERVGTTEDFFELGGHSLNATQVASRVREAFHVEMPLRTMFESPTIESLAKAISELQRVEATGEAPPPITSVSRDQELPLSFAQQRLWFLDQLEPGDSLYNVPRTLRLTGKLNVSALEDALTGLVERHEILRTSYQISGDHPIQVIAPATPVKLPVFDRRDLPGTAREDEARRMAQADAATPFNLAAGPALRCMLIQLGDEDHVLCLNTHHIASDGWSTGVLLNDLSELYAAALDKRKPKLAPLEIQYADYAAWQRKWLDGEVLNSQLRYWRKALAGAPPLLLLPTDRKRPEVQRFRGATYDTSISRTLTQGIRSLSKQQGVTSFMTMLAGFKSLLHFLTGQHDIVIGTDMANRTSVQTEPLIGFFVNLLVLRTDLSGNPSFEELLAREREVAIGAYAHQDLPFDKLVEELRPERNLSYSPVVQVLFVQQNTPRSNSSMPGLEIGRFALEVQSKFDMAVFMREAGNQVFGSWVYNPDLFDAGTITRMAANLEMVLDAAVADPKVQLSALCDLLTSVEKQQRGSEHKKFQEAGLEKLKKVRRKAIAEV
jgi:amino acid adenylation domain-containing protein/FkbH-like protein